RAAFLWRRTAKPRRQSPRSPAAITDQSVRRPGYPLDRVGAYVFRGGCPGERAPFRNRRFGGTMRGGRKPRSCRPRGGRQTLMDRPNRSDRDTGDVVMRRAWISERLRVNRESGQATTEFALILVPLLILVTGIIYFGIGLNYWLDMQR